MFRRMRLNFLSDHADITGGVSFSCIEFFSPTKKRYTFVTRQAFQDRRGLADGKTPSVEVRLD